jgi:hypothetical protein
MFPDRDTRADETATAGGQETAAAATTTTGVVRGGCPLAAAAPSAAAAQHYGSGGEPSGGRVCITVAPFTGGPFQVAVSRADTIEDLKRVIARRLKVSKERIYLLYRDRYSSYSTVLFTIQYTETRGTAGDNENV